MLPFVSVIKSDAIYLWHHFVQRYRQWMNRAVVSLVRDRGPAVLARDKMGWPSFLIRNNPDYASHCRQATPQRELLLVLTTFTLTSFIHLFPKFNLLLVHLWSQRSFCVGGAVTRHVFSTGFTWPLLSVASTGARLKGAPQKHERRSEMRTSLSFILLRGLTPVWKYVHLLLRKEGRKGGNTSLGLNCSSCALISVLSACSLTSHALEGCLSPQWNAHYSIPPVSKVLFPLAKTKILSSRNLSCRVHRGKADQITWFTALLPSGWRWQRDLRSGLRAKRGEWR